MKVIILEKNKKEVGRLLPDKRTLMIGRAPICDLVVRNQDMNPIHFVIEWMGEGAFDPYSGLWTIFDRSENTTSSKKEQISGEAQILSEDPVSLDGYHIRIVEEKLAASAISKGVLTRSLDLEKDDKVVGSLASSEKVLELVTYNTEVDVVTSVSHFSKDQINRGMKITSLPKINFQMDPQGHYLVLENQGESNLTDLYNRGDRIIEKFQKQSDKIIVDHSDFYLIYSQENAYYLRWVQKHLAHPPPSAWKKDPVVLTLIAVVIIMFIFAIALQFMDKPKPVEIPKPQRVVTVQLLDETTPAEDVQAPLTFEQESKKEIEKDDTPEKKPEPKKQEAKPSEKPVPEKNRTAPTPPTNMAKKMKTKELGKRATVKNVEDNKDLSVGLNQNAPIKNVNTVGLLGKLGGSKKSGTGISADAVISKVKPTDSASGEAGKIAVLQPPTGKVNLTGAGKTMASDGDTQGLSGATTTLKMDSVGKGGKIQGIASSKATGSIGKGAFGGNQTGGSDSIQSLGGAVALETKAMEVQGGLTKEQVRQAISDNRRALRNCHEQFLTYKKDLGGRIVLKWKIGGEGPVDSINTQSTNTGYPNFDECVTQVIKKIVFPKAPNGNSTIVIYPFLFQPKK